MIGKEKIKIDIDQDKRGSLSVTPAPEGQSRARLAGLILAAGQSSRFGADKRLAPFGNGETLLTCSIALIEPFCEKVFVATRAEESERGPELLGRWWKRGNIEQFCAPDSAQGMGSTLANAMQRIRDFERAQGVEFSGLLLSLADMPYIKPETIVRIVAAHSIDNISLPCYHYPNGRKRCGHPVIFGRKWFDDLLTLRGDRGARRVIEVNAAARSEVPVNDSGIFRDVDRAEDLASP